jgi:hypothetical protein
LLILCVCFGVQFYIARRYGVNFARRLTRFLMNAMLASGGYPWTVIRVEDRTAYLTALDRASIDLDIGPFAAFIAQRVQWSLEQAG